MYNNSKVALTFNWKGQIQNEKKKPNVCIQCGIE